jgi:hypothetical protein
MREPETNPGAYAGLFNLLELVVPPVVEHYISQVVPLACDCHQCRRDVAAAALSMLSPLYYGSLTEATPVPPIRLDNIFFEAIDQKVRRAVSMVNHRPHHGRRGFPPDVEVMTPPQLADRMVQGITSRPLLEQLYGIPVPMCVRCNEFGRRQESRFCDRCGGPLLEGLPSTDLNG